MFAQYAEPRARAKTKRNKTQPFPPIKDNVKVENPIASTKFKLDILYHGYNRQGSFPYRKRRLPLRPTHYTLRGFD